MSKTKLDDRSTIWAVVLNKPVEDTGFNVYEIYKKLKIYDYVACCLHDQDTKNGVLETIHIQIALKTTRKRKETLINELGELLGFSKEVISIEKCTNWRRLNRYIIHYDEEEEGQHHYTPLDVYTNDMHYFQSFLIDRVDNLCEEDLINIVNEHKTSSKILERIGIENYKKYQFIIRDLQKEILER